MYVTALSLLLVPTLFHNADDSVCLLARSLLTRRLKRVSVPLPLVCTGVLLLPIHVPSPPLLSSIEYGHALYDPGKFWSAWRASKTYVLQGYREFLYFIVVNG